MFIDAGFPGEPERGDGRSFGLKKFAVAVALFFGVLLLGSALNGAWLINLHGLLPVNARPIEVPASAHRCAIRATGDWSSCAARNAVPITRCTRVFHSSRRPTYDCLRPDARPIFPPRLAIGVGTPVSHAEPPDGSGATRGWAA
jgi:hypothetical protein